MLPFIAGSLHCISIQQNAILKLDVQTQRELYYFDAVEPHLSLDSSSFDTILLEYQTIQPSADQNEISQE